MNSELYTQCVEEAAALLGKEPKHEQMRQLWYTYAPFRSSPPDWNQEFLNWLKDKVNEKVFRASTVHPDCAQIGMDI